MSPANKGSQTHTTTEFIAQFSMKILERINCQQQVLTALTPFINVRFEHARKNKIVKNLFPNSLSSVILECNLKSSYSD